MELILLRHGATEGNLRREYIGRTDEPLAEEGRRQARALNGRLPRPELLFVSPMRRCRETAALVWPGVEQIEVPGLRESDFGRFEGKTWAELKEDPEYRAWIDGRADCPGGETRKEVSRRVLLAGEDCLRRVLEARCGTAAMVAHGGTMMELLSRYAGGDFYEWQTPLCGGWSVEVSADGSWSSLRRLEVEP